MVSFSTLLQAQETPPAPVVAASAGHSADDLAKQLANPVAALISLPIQENIDFGYANDGWRSTTNIQPVIPFSLSEDWNLISRTIVPINIQEDVRGPGSSEEGFGDILQTFFFSPKAPGPGGFIWGAGPVVSVPVGADAFTTDRWLLGPSAVLLKQQGPWTYGALLNHVWDAGGPGSADVSASFIQPFCAWGGLGQGRTIAVNSESTYDWNAEQWTVPVNAMFTKVSKIGSQLVSYQVGARVYLDAPAGGLDWGLRAAITFLFPR